MSFHDNTFLDTILSLYPAASRSCRHNRGIVPRLGTGLRTGGIEPPLPFEIQIFIPLRLSPPNATRASFVVWTIPSPCPVTGFRRRPSSLYTFPASGLGSGLAWA